jgi:hypothetical protein
MDHEDFREERDKCMTQNRKFADTHSYYSKH